jgi:hypothetical protein
MDGAIMRKTLLGVGAALALVLATPVLAQDNVYSGVGSAPVTRDTAAVQTRAEQDARVALVQTIARQLLGAERMGEVTPDMARRLADQIRPEMIVDRRFDKVGSVYQVTLSARVDRAWFMGLLDDEGIRSTSAMAGGGGQRILVLLDEAVGPARDYARPLQVTTEYDRSTGSSYSDQSALSYSDKVRAGSSQSSQSAVSAKAAGAAGYSNGYGSAGVAASGSLEAAAKSKSASAYSSTTTLKDKTDVEANAYEDVRFRQTVVYQASATSRTGQAAMAGLTEQLIRYDISTANGTGALASFAPGKPPLFTDLQSRGELSRFFAQIQKTSNAPFFMGGTMQIQDNGPHPATGQPTCTGSLNAQAFATASSADIASALVSGETSASSYELCTSKLSGMLAQQAGDKLGPQVQRYWRGQVRDRSSVVQATTAGPVDYTLTVRGSNLDMAAQADFLDALTALPGVESQVFLEQVTGQFSLQVRYSGSTPLHLALFQRLRSNPAFAKMTSETAPRQVTICLNGCR